MAAQIEMLLPRPQWVIFISIFAVLLDHLPTAMLATFFAHLQHLEMLLGFCFPLSLFFVGFGLAKNFCLQLRGPKKKLLLEMFCGMTRGRAWQREGGTYRAFWHSLATVFGVCWKNFSYVNNSMRDGQGKRCQRAANY